MWNFEFWPNLKTETDFREIEHMTHLEAEGPRMKPKNDLRIKLGVGKDWAQP